MAIIRRYHLSKDQLVHLAAVLGVRLQLLPGVDDEDSACRWRPIAKVDLNVSGIAFWHCECAAVRFAIMLGHPFGLSRAVLNYSRGPALEIFSSAAGLQRHLRRDLMFFISDQQRYVLKRRYRSKLRGPWGIASFNSPKYLSQLLHSVRRKEGDLFSRKR